MSFQLIVRSQFSAAHALYNYSGKCERLHGHNFTVEAAIEGKEISAESGMLIDFSILKKALEGVLEPLDHTVLNDLPAFRDISPSSENLAQYIGCELANTLAAVLKHNGATIYSVAVSEKNAQTAIWFAQGRCPGTI